MAWLLSLCLLISCVPAMVYAEDSEATEAPPIIMDELPDAVNEETEPLDETEQALYPDAETSQEEAEPAADSDESAEIPEEETAAMDSKESEQQPLLPQETAEEPELPADQPELPAEDPEESGEEPAEELPPIDSYADFMSCLKLLEQRANAFAQEHSGEDPVGLVINYIRCGVEKYNSSTWNTFCGEEKTAFTAFVTSCDEQEGTSVRRLRDLECFAIPNGDQVEFAHMFGCLDMAYHTGNQNTADLGSWAGDICDLLQLSQNGGVTGTVEEMAEEIRTNHDKYFLYDDPNAHSFGILDFLADMDAFYIIRNLSGDNTISTVMQSYYTANLDDSFRTKFFIDNRLGGASTKAQIRTVVYDIYRSNEGITTLEGSYLPEGVNPDIRQACCYAFADHLFLTAQDKLENPYFTTFSTETSRIAPGVTQQIKMAITQDDKQIVYYIANVDVSRQDVTVCANYGDNDGSTWTMRRVTDQMKAAELNHSDPESDRYVPYYSAVVGVNGDFYNMSTGKPTGALVMEGVQYNGAGSENFFAMLKDGTPMIGAPAQWNSIKDQVQEAVGCNIMLVKDGKIAISSNSNYYASRASRTCVGITYDGHVILMVLDGRQEPFSCGGSNIEIAQIMLDAGCVVAANLDGGGSTTFAAKAEGSDEIALVNRPSDGYERSVSSSLMVVSTAKPSNIFDHAMVSADYDYLTVGTSMQIRTTGVTATGGAIDLPEGTSLVVSDNSIGSVSEDQVFTAAALGDVQLQLKLEDGTVIGSKTLHVVEPTDLDFGRNTLNVVLGEPSELPMEAYYNGNLVKINPSDVTFGFVKISLQSIGNVEGGDVNTTKMELVFSYPEAGSIDGFSFTANPESEIRTLTVGAVLTNRMEEFQAALNEEFMRVYQQALADGYSADQAALMAQTAAINKALNEEAKIVLYFYSAEEATFDFDNATGGDGLLSWKREVSNSHYHQLTNTYIIQDPAEDMEVQYTFAVDMSKVPIPEKLTGLLYMLPGGDQEGRTAWDFMLQLAERISPLTTVTVVMELPQGFQADISNLRLANEYLSLSSAEVHDNQLTIICNFIAQSEPINPANANPLCVLSGLKLTPTEEAAWDENQQLNVEFNGKLSYDIYAHFHILMNLCANEEYQIQYGLYPYDNRTNDPNDYGAHFQNEVVDFYDAFTLDRFINQGWVWENGAWFYYENGEILTGIHKLPSFEAGEEGEFWYDLGSNGACSAKLTGIFELDGSYYYSRMGILQTGWLSIQADDGESYVYYGDPANGQLYTGVREIKTLTYTFDETGKLIRGAFRTNDKGTKYFWAGESVFRRFVTLEEGTYWLDVDGYVAYGNAFTVTDNVKDITWYHFDEQTGLLDGICSGLIEYRGELYYCDENGKVFYGVIGIEGGLIYCGTRGKLYVDSSFYVDSSTQFKDCSLPIGLYKCGADGFVISDGFVDIGDGTYYFTDYQRALGFTKIGEDYYLFNAGSGKMYKDASMWVGTNSYGVEPGMHYFDADGKMFIPDLENGEKKIVEENGKLYFTIDGVKLNNGLNELDGEYYYAQNNYVLVTDKTIWVSQKNGLIPEKGVWYYFGPDGKMLQTGFVNGGDGFTYYYDQNVLALGFTKIGEDYYMFNAGSGKLYKDATLWVGANAWGVETGMHYFDLEGKMFIPDLENGEKEIISENGKLYFTIDGVKMTNGLNELDGEYYYAQANGVLVTNATIWVNQKNGLIPEKGDYHAFAADGKMIQTGFVTGGGYTYYYDQNVLALGFTKIGEDYYLFNAGSGKMYKDADMWVGENAYGVETGMHHFGSDGKMFIPDLENGEKEIISENGKLYFTIDGVKMTNGLYELDGEYYYAQANGVLVTNATIWVSQKNGLIPEKGDYHAFAADGKMIQTGFVTGGGYTYYYDQNVLALGFTKIGEDYYMFNAGSGKMYKDANMWVGANDYGVETGMHYFGADGKME